MSSDQVTEQEFSSDPVIGDGVVTLPVKKKEVSSMDLPEGVGQLMMTETAGNIQASNRNSRNTSDVVMGALQGTVVQNFKDVGVVEGRSVSGILATPIAGPASAQK
jgi:hypothetical protein